MKLECRVNKEFWFNFRIILSTKISQCQGQTVFKYYKSVERQQPCKYQCSAGSSMDENLTLGYTAVYKKSSLKSKPLPSKIYHWFTATLQ